MLGNPGGRSTSSNPIAADRNARKGKPRGATLAPNADQDSEAEPEEAGLRPCWDHPSTQLPLTVPALLWPACPWAVYAGSSPIPAAVMPVDTPH